MALKNCSGYCCSGKNCSTHSNKNSKGCIAHRRATLLQELQIMYCEEDGANNSTMIFIEYKISGIKVCKDFYHEASGISDRMFNDAVAYVLGLRTSDDLARYLNKDNIDYSTNVPKKVIRQCSDERAQHVIKFLHHYFTYSVDYSPNGKYYLDYYKMLFVLLIRSCCCYYRRRSTLYSFYIHIPV